jgi:hypothetical protein
MDNEWLGSWQPHTDQLGADDHGLKQLIAACGSNIFDDMYEQIVNPALSTAHEAEEVGASLQFTDPGGVEAENTVPDAQSYGEFPAGGDGSLPSNGPDTREPTYNDLLDFESNVSPYIIGDLNMDDLMGMYGNEQSAGPEDVTTLCRGDETSGSEACVYPTPASSASSGSDPDVIDLKR